MTDYRLTEEDKRQTVNRLKYVTKELGTTYCCRVLKCSLPTLKAVMLGNQEASEAFIKKLRPFYKRVKNV